MGVATGEVAQNKVIFKQLLQEKAIEFCQIDSCRIAGPSEIFSVLLMCAKLGVKVCPHAGGVGLCEYLRHLAMIDYCCFSGSLEGRACESTTHLRDFFEDPVDFQRLPGGSLRYLAPKAPGFAKFLPSSLEEWEFPRGSAWGDASEVGALLKGRADEARLREASTAADVRSGELALLSKRKLEELAEKCSEEPPD